MEWRGLCSSEAGCVLVFSSQDLEGWRRSLVLLGPDVEAISAGRKVGFIEDSDMFIFIFTHVEYADRKD